MFFESYYGEKYSGIFLDTIIDYLDGRSESFLMTAARVITKRFSRIYNKVPDVSVIEKNIDEILYSMPKTAQIEEPKKEFTAEKLKEMEAGMELMKKELERLSAEKGETPMAKYLTKEIQRIVREKKEA